ncbi:MAG TPA: hypothetical protein H9775_06340, partial [Candidatus Blautia merdipullorum]|nr:hypothetical protein [Candidatus Blautia merdipullorum]
VRERILFSVSSFLAYTGRTRVCKNEPLWDYVIAAIGSGLMAACSTESPENRKSPESPQYQAFRA